MTDLTRTYAMQGMQTKNILILVMLSLVHTLVNAVTFTGSILSEKIVS